MTDLIAGADILVVDDTPQNLRLLGEMLKLRGYKARPVPSGKLALQAARNALPDLVLLDINMPEMDGYETCRQFRADPTLAKVPIIFISALSETEDKVRAFEAGGLDYVTKPFRHEEVYARVETHLKLARTRAALENMLQKTLYGSLRALMDVMALFNSGVVSRSDSLHRQMGEFSRRLGHAPDWSHLLAASYSQLGLLAATPELDEAIRKGTPLLARDRGELSKSFEMSADIIQHIPGLEPVVSIIRQFTRIAIYNDYPTYKNAGDETRGAIMLGMLFEAHILRMRNYNAAKIVETMVRSQKGLAEEALAALKALLEEEEKQILKAVSCPIESLKPGMVLMEDILTLDRRKLLSEGAEITDSMILLLRHFIGRGQIRDQVKIATYSYSDARG